MLWIIIHVILGISATFSPFPTIVWFYLVFFTSLAYLVKPTSNPTILLAVLLYLVSFELLARMARTSPFIPYELGKYLLFIGVLWGIIRFKTNGLGGWMMLLALLPSLFIDLSGRVSRTDLVFNILGPVNVALVAVFFYRQKVSVSSFASLIRLMVYPILGVLSFSVIKSPDFENVEFSLGANVDWSGGFGSNQASTLFGLGALLVFILILNKWKFSGYFILDVLILFGLTFQGLLTFSRGGMLGAVVGMFIILVYLRFADVKSKIRFRLPNVGKYALPIILVGVTAYLVVDELTSGLLSMRYAGETAGTLQGSKIKSINSITTGRFEIFVGDLDLWFEHFVLGVGAGASSFLRQGMHGTVAHVELSRLLAEHGLFGLFYFIILLFMGWNLLRGHPNPMFRGILVAFFVVALYTTFHAAMRTFLTPALVGLSLLYVKIPKRSQGKTPVRRSQDPKKLVSVK